MATTNGNGEIVSGSKVKVINSVVQKEVNRIFGGANTKSIDTLAREVIQGKWGNGSERKSATVRR